MMDQPIRVDRESLILGYAGVYFSFLLFAQRADQKYRVYAGDVLVEMGRRKAVGGQEDLFEEVALEFRRRDAQAPTGAWKSSPYRSLSVGVTHVTGDAVH